MDWFFKYLKARKHFQKELPLSLFFLTKRQPSKNWQVKLVEKGQTVVLGPKEFEEKFEIELLSGLYFENLSDLKWIVKAGLKAWEVAEISALERWLGSYHEEELEKGEAGPVYLKWLGAYKGYGLFAAQDLEENTYIGEYAGVVRRHKKSLDEANAYCFEYPVASLRGKTPFTIDAKESGNCLRFINHSSKPNLFLKRAYGQGVMHIILKTKEKISKDTELTYDYGPTYWKKRPKPLP